MKTLRSKASSKSVIQLWAQSKSQAVQIGPVLLALPPKLPPRQVGGQDPENFTGIQRPGLLFTGASQVNYTFPHYTSAFLQKGKEQGTLERLSNDPKQTDGAIQAQDFEFKIGEVLVNEDSNLA